MTNKQTDQQKVKTNQEQPKPKKVSAKKTNAKSPAKKRPQPAPKASPGKLDAKARESKAVEDVKEAPATTSPTPATDTGDKPKKILGGKRKAVAIRDKETGELYSSKSKAGKALAAEFELDPSDSFVWYKIVKKAPERFEER